MNIYKVQKNKAFLTIQTRNFNTATFQVDREIVPWLSSLDWQLRSNGTAIDTLSKAAFTHLIYVKWNGWKPNKIQHINGDVSDCRIVNLRAILN